MNIFELLIVLLAELGLVISWIYTIPQDHNKCFGDMFHKYGLSEEGGCKGLSSRGKQKRKCLNCPWWDGR